MPANVTLTVTQGPLIGQSFVFDERTTCILGRAEDCFPQLPDTEDHKQISRHHCLLDLNPPDVRIRDFGSRNGTFVDGQKIGQRAENMTPEEGARVPLPEFDLKHGSEIQLGYTCFRVSIFLPPRCCECGQELSEGVLPTEDSPTFTLRCIGCSEKTTEESKTTPGLLVVHTKICLQCGKDVGEEMGELRNGHFVCAPCRAAPDRIVTHLLALASAGVDEARALRGYHLVKKLGQGGMGAVFLVESEQGELFALKIMVPKIATDLTARNRFLREVECTQALNHPNIVRFHNTGCVQGVFFLVLEFCAGGNLSEYLEQQGGRLNVTQALALVLPVLDGLEYAHNVFGTGKALVHRDLKPQNLFLTQNAEPHILKIGDYGLAKAFDQAGLSGLTCTGTLMGSPAFMPRQQVVNFKYAKPEADVWAMAATLYYLLTHHYPREFKKGGGDWWKIVLQTDAIPIRERIPTIPARFAEVIDRALVDRPAIGFSSAASFKKAIEECA